jgi:hypothetical protein
VDVEQFSVNTLAKTLIVVGGVIVLAGIVILLAGKIPFLGKLPGDISLKGKGFSIYFPIVTCLVVSVVLTIILNLIFRK